MLLPDEYALAVKSSYTISEWAEAEKAGAVFFPETGIQDGKGYLNKESGDNKAGYYWTSTYSSTTTANSLYFNMSSLPYNTNVLNAYGSTNRYKGIAVRLVHDIDE